MAPLIKSLKKSEILDVAVCVTAQHREMLDQVLQLFDVKPDFDLNLMRSGQTLSSLTCSILEKIEPVIEAFQPNWVVVHGDTNTTMATSLAAYYKKVNVAHVEAGLRTGNLYSPWPEEANRQITARLSELHFAPTDAARANLLAEGISPEKIFVTGNTVIDALMGVSQRIEDDASLRETLEQKFPFLNAKKRLLLVTGHRRENFGIGFENICHALKELAGDSRIQIVYPVHLNPNVQEPVLRILGNSENVHLIEPQDYLPFVYLMKASAVILTDSGGIQEEAPSLGKPVLVMRDTSERPEAIAAGTALLVGTHRESIVREVLRIINDDDVYKGMATSHNPYGDGMACQRITSTLEKMALSSEE